MLQEVRFATYINVSFAPERPSLPGGASPGIWLATLGRFTSLGSFVFEQIPAHFSVHVIESGAGVMRVGGKEYDVSRGDIFAFFPRCHVRYWDHPGTPWRYTWCDLDGPGAAECLRLAGLSPEHPHLRGEFGQIVEPLFKEAEEALMRLATSRAFAVSFAWRMIDLIDRGRERPPAIGKRDVAEIAKSLLDGHFSASVGIAEIARQIGVSRATLFRKFKDAYGRSPKEYLDGVRIDRARKLLRESEAPLREIAAACGYEDAHYFIRAYKQATGRTPGRERGSE